MFRVHNLLHVNENWYVNDSSSRAMTQRYISWILENIYIKQILSLVSISKAKPKYVNILSI